MVTGCVSIFSPSVRVVVTFDEERRYPTEFIDDWQNKRGSQFDPAEVGSSASPEQRQRIYRTGQLQKDFGHNKWRTKEGKRKQRLREKRDAFDIVASQLELTPYRRQQTEMVFMQLDLQRLGLPMELVAFCLCALAARQDGRMYHPNRSEENNDKQFLDFAQSLSEREQSLIVKTLNRLQHRLSDQFGW